MALPHAIATTLRCWRLRRSIDRDVVLRFGVLSAVGGLAGAAIYTQIGVSALTRVLGAFLILTAVTQLTGWAARWQPRRPLVAVFGLISGLFGGLAGNQGGLRAGAMTAFGLSPAAFVATATAIGIMVDAARTPVYLVVTGADLVTIWVPIAVAILGVIVGTVLGERFLLGLSPARFGRIVAVAIAALGVWLLVSPP